MLGVMFLPCVSTDERDKKKGGICILCIVIPIAVVLAILLALAVILAIWFCCRRKAVPLTAVKGKQTGAFIGFVPYYYILSCYI